MSVLKKYWVIIVTILLTSFISHDYNKPVKEKYRIIIRSEDSFIRWSRDYRLKFSDFEGSIPPKIPSSKYDTQATSNCTVGYKLMVIEKKLAVEGFALFNKKLSWMRADAQSQSLLQHEQGHFDITQIYAAEFQNTVNNANFPDTHGFIEYLGQTYHRIMQEYRAEQEKYDIWTLNTLGREHYDTWIKQQLDSLLK